MPQPKDMEESPARTEEERLAQRRFEAYFAFETQWQPKNGNLSCEQFGEVSDAG
jgi:hypothetical protein